MYAWMLSFDLQDASWYVCSYWWQYHYVQSLFRGRGKDNEHYRSLIQHLNVDFNHRLVKSKHQKYLLSLHGSEERRTIQR